MREIRRKFEGARPIFTRCFRIFRISSEFIIEAPKIYWLASGLLCHLLRVRNQSEISVHPFKGAIFELFVLSEILKRFFNYGLEPDVYFWRDRSGHEIDAIIEKGYKWLPVEIKSSETISHDHFFWTCSDLLC